MLDVAAGLLTGNYQQRLGFEENLGNDLSQQWGYKGNETLLPDRLKALGYTTGMVGKWHNGYINGVNRPTDMGFDEFFGFLSGSRQYYGDGAPSNLMLRNNTVVEGQWRTQGNPATYDPVRGRYVTDAFGDEAVDYINRHANDPNPFYLHLAFTASHTPYGVKQQDYDLFSNIADNERSHAGGHDVRIGPQRRQRHERAPGQWPRVEHDRRLRQRQRRHEPQRQWADSRIQGVHVGRRHPRAVHHQSSRAGAGRL